MATIVYSSGDSLTKTSFHASLSKPIILEKIFQLLPLADFLSCRRVCRTWKSGALARFNGITADPTHPHNCRKYRATFDGIMLEPIVDQIISCLPSKELQCQSRLISQTFNYIVKHKLSFAPVLTDWTLISFLSIDQDLHVSQLVVRDLFSSLPLTEAGGKLDCNFNTSRVNSILFYEGVPVKNKEILLDTFPRLNELNYIGSSSFVYFQEDGVNALKFEYLHKLHIKADATNDLGNLIEFLHKAKFPVLKTLNLNFYFRRDFSLYFEAHNFIGNHHKTLKDVTLAFCPKHDYIPPESISGTAATYTPQLVSQLHQLTNITFHLLQLNNLSLDLLPFEGTSLFILGFALAESQKQLKNLRLYKEYTYTRHELLPLHSILLNNAGTLVNINIPHPYLFNCACIQDCRHLESLQIGEVPYNRRFPMTFSDSDVLNITHLPRLPTFVKLKVGIRLSRTQLDWIMQHHQHQLTEFCFNGHQSEQYTLEDILGILHLQKKLEDFGFNCEMNKHEYDLIAEYCRENKGIVRMESIYGGEGPYVTLGDSRGKFQVSIDRQVFNNY